jgi:hypothetical protein
MRIKKVKDYAGKATPQGRTTAKKWHEELAEL